MSRKKLICIKDLSNKEAHNLLKLICVQAFDPRGVDFKVYDVYYTSQFHTDNENYYLITIPGRMDRRVPKHFFLTPEQLRVRTIKNITDE